MNELRESLQRLARLPETTVVYPGHMYSPAPHATMADVQAKNYVYRLRSKDQWMIMFGGA